MLCKESCIVLTSFSWVQKIKQNCSLIVLWKSWCLISEELDICLLFRFLCGNDIFCFVILKCLIVVWPSCQLLCFATTHFWGFSDHLVASCLSKNFSRALLSYCGEPYGRVSSEGWGFCKHQGIVSRLLPSDLKVGKGKGKKKKSQMWEYIVRKMKKPKEGALQCVSECTLELHIWTVIFLIQQCLIMSTWKSRWFGGKEASQDPLLPFFYLFSSLHESSLPKSGYVLLRMFKIVFHSWQFYTGVISFTNNDSDSWIKRSILWSIIGNVYTLFVSVKDLWEMNEMII